MYLMIEIWMPIRSIDSETERQNKILKEIVETNLILKSLVNVSEHFSKIFLCE